MFLNIIFVVKSLSVIDEILVFYVTVTQYFAFQFLTRHAGV